MPLKEIREHKGMSIRTLAEKAGVSVATIVRIEKERNKPNWQTLEKLANALHVSVSKLIKEN